jgi:hypothetical protein
MCLSANPLRCKNLGSVFLRTAWPYPGTTLPYLRVLLTNSSILALFGLYPWWNSLSSVNHLRHYWLAKPWRGPAKPFIAAEYDK